MAIQLFFGLGIPADVHQEADHALALADVLPLDSTQESGHDRAWNLVGLHLAEPEAVNSAVFDDMRSDFD